MELRDSVALVTGASRGLGLATARLLAARGARLIVAARDARELASAAAELEEATHVVAVPADVAEAAERIVRAGIERFGRVDILVNNASELGPSPLPELGELAWHQFERILRVNVIAPLHLTQLVLPFMRINGAGAIVNITSDAAVNAYATWGGYGASKAALEQLSRVLAEELKGSGIRVLVIDPGDMNTAMHELAEPGVDLSHLPGPLPSAHAIVRLLESDSPAFGRFEAQSLVPVSP